VMGAATDSVFHLSALEAVRGAPDDPDGLDRALLRSFDSTRALLDACRHQLRRPRLVYAGLRGLRSGGAVAPDTEGTCIDLCESLLAEAARRKLIELRSLRLATRPAPGSPPAALEAAAQALVGAHERNTPLEMALIIEDGNA